MFEFTEEKRDWALEVLHGDRHARAKAAFEKMDREKKVILARLTREANDKTVSEREGYALTHPHYAAFLENLGTVEEEYYLAKDERDSADAYLRAWQTQRADQRGFDRRVG